MRYAALGLPLGAIAATFAWNGAVMRATMLIERRPPVLGEVHELEEAEQARA